jgi:hypothetical protein
MGGADPSLRRRVGRWVSLVLSPAYNHEVEASMADMVPVIGRID